MDVLTLVGIVILVVPNLGLIVASVDEYDEKNMRIAIAKSNCNSTCGNVSIPFPFGTSQSCYLSPQFLISCNTSCNPPQALLTHSSIQVLHISLQGQIRVLQSIAYSCPRTQVCTCINAGKTPPHPQVLIPEATRSSNFLDDPRQCTCIDKEGKSWINLESFTVNNTANKLTVVGCDTDGFVTGKRRGGLNYTTGCTATCDSMNDAENGTCDGVGCCQSSFPKQVQRVDLQITSPNNYSYVKDFNDCGFAFVVEKDAFNFSSKYLTGFADVDKLPMVVDWAIGNGTCEEAKSTPAEYACKSVNSSCYQPDNGSGYRCACDNGYIGNPYLVDGCKDVDECADPKLNHCVEKGCRNIPGDYECFCPQGYHGDGKRDGRGCSRGESLVFRLVAGILLGVIVLLLSSCWVYMTLQRRRLIKMRQQYFRQNGGLLLQEKLKGSSNSAKLFTESVLMKATNGFHENNIIGEGGFGTVYKGLLPGDDKAIAIKRPKSLLKQPREVDDFTNEFIILCQINHRNVVKLLGCCLETQAPLLVYEFVSNGTLAQHIHNKDKARALSWNTRLSIAAETASVLAYLHSSASPPIIHRDIKSTNILLDHDFTAKVSDFGASKLFPLDREQVTTVVMGTRGYLDPEYYQTGGQLTAKSDVYSFGVVLAELLTGREAVCIDRPEEERSLANFFFKMAKEEELLFKILDQDKVVGDGNKEHVLVLAKLAARCLNSKGDERPCMKEVERELQGLIVLVEKRNAAAELSVFGGKDLELSSFDSTTTTISMSTTTSTGFYSFNTT